MKFPPHEQVAALGTLVAQLSIESQWLLSYIANYLTFINQYVDKNLMTFDNLAIVFAPSIFRKKVRAPSFPFSWRKQAQNHFLPPLFSQLGCDSPR